MNSYFPSFFPLFSRLYWFIWMLGYFLKSYISLVMFLAAGVVGVLIRRFVVVEDTFGFGFSVVLGLLGI